MSNPRREAIAEKAQEALAEKIEEYVRELFESIVEDEDLSLADEDQIDSEVEDIFERWKDEIEEAARRAFEHNNDVHEAIWGGFGHLDFCVDTAKEVAERIAEEEF